MKPWRILETQVIAMVVAGSKKTTWKSMAERLKNHVPHIASRMGIQLVCSRGMRMTMMTMTAVWIAVSVVMRTTLSRGMTLTSTFHTKQQTLAILQDVKTYCPCIRSTPISPSNDLIVIRYPQSYRVFKIRCSLEVCPMNCCD